MVMKRATAAADANKVLSSRLASVERERDANRALVSTERQRAEEMISVAEVARAQVASREVQLQRFVSHNSFYTHMALQFLTLPSLRHPHPTLQDANERRSGSRRFQVKVKIVEASQVYCE